MQQPFFLRGSSLSKQKQPIEMQIPLKIQLAPPSGISLAPPCISVFAEEATAEAKPIGLDSLRPSVAGFGVGPFPHCPGTWLVPLLHRELKTPSFQQFPLDCRWGDPPCWNQGNILRQDSNVWLCDGRTYPPSSLKSEGNLPLTWNPRVVILLIPPKPFQKQSFQWLSLIASWHGGIAQVPWVICWLAPEPPCC